MNRNELNERFQVTDNQLNAQAREYAHRSWQGTTEHAKLGQPKLCDGDLKNT